MRRLTTDVIQALAPSVGAFGFITLTDAKDIMAIVSLAVGTICTVLITAKKLRRK